MGDFLLRALRRRVRYRRWHRKGIGSGFSREKSEGYGFRSIPYSDRDGFVAVMIHPLKTVGYGISSGDVPLCIRCRSDYHDHVLLRRYEENEGCIIQEIVYYEV